jgi:hypothetical protein
MHIVAVFALWVIKEELRIVICQAEPVEAYQLRELPRSTLRQAQGDR